MYQIMPATERPSSSASACSRLIVVAEAKTSIDNTMDETIPAPSTSTSPKTEEKVRWEKWFCKMQLATFSDELFCLQKT